MIEISKPIYRDENAKELNEKIEKLLNSLEMENESIIEIIMDITLNHSERKEKTFWEVVKNSENYQELLTLQSRNNTLELIISELKSIIYSDYEKVPIKLNKTPEPRLSSESCRIWLGTKVKPLILSGMSKQSDISDKLGIGASTISTRVKSGYGDCWKDYVELVIDGTY